MAISSKRFVFSVISGVVFFTFASSQSTTTIDLTNLTSPVRTACFPVFHSRYGMWVDPCHHVVHIPRGWHGTLECNGPASGLSIVGARYGPLCQNVNSQNACANTCKASNVAPRARDICGSGQKQRCRIKARDELFTNPCPDQPAVLVVSFTCDHYIWSDEAMVGLDGQLRESSSGGAKVGNSADFRMAEDSNIFLNSSRCRKPDGAAKGFSAVGCPCTGASVRETENSLQFLEANLRVDLGRALSHNVTTRLDAGRQIDVSSLILQNTFRGICYSNDNPNFKAENSALNCERLTAPLSSTACFSGESCCQPAMKTL